MFSIKCNFSLVLLDILIYDMNNDLTFIAGLVINNEKK